MVDDHSDIDSRIVRRRFMKGMGAAGSAAFLAGCGGREAGNGNGDGNGNGNGGSSVEAGEGVETGDDELAQIQELAWIVNQELPVLPLMEKLAQSFQATNNWDVPEPDDNVYMHYWPTEWLPRWGEWQADGDDDTLSLTQWDVPEDSQYNPWNLAAYPEAHRGIYDRFMSYNVVEAEYDGHAIADWEFEGDAIDLTLRDGLVWHDGDDVTPTDLANQLKLDMYAGGILREYVDDVSEDVQETDDGARIEFNQTLNEHVPLGTLQPTHLVAKDSVYGEYVEGMDDAADEDEELDVFSDLADMAVEEPIGSGPFQFEDADSQRVRCSVFEDHPDADKINFDYVEYRYQPSNESRWNALQGEELDGEATLFMPQNQVDLLPDHVQIVEIPRHWGMGIVFNYDDEHMSNRAVRRAIAHVIDRELVAENSAAGTGSKLPVSIPSGVTGEFEGRVENHWLEGVADEFDRYETDEDRAAQLLEDAGYAREDGTWVDENGEPIEASIHVPEGFSDWVSAVETAVDHLAEFGFEAEMITQAVDTYFGQTFPESDFVMGVEGWANFDQTYPWYHFDNIFVGGEGSLQASGNFPDEFDVEALHDDVRDGGAVDPVDLIDTLATIDDGNA